MNINNATEAVQQLRRLCEESIETGEFTEDAHAEIRRVCEELRSADQFDKWGSELIQIIEKYDDKVDLTVGYPGDFGHALESGGLDRSCKLYIESLNRKPTGLVTGLAERAYRSCGSDCGFGIELFQLVLKSPSATLSAKEIAGMVVNES